MLRVVNIVGTRPNLVKMSPVLAAQKARPDLFEPRLVHTGQHRDPAMSQQFFAELELPEPDVTLEHDGRRRRAPAICRPSREVRLTELV